MVISLYGNKNVKVSTQFRLMVNQVHDFVYKNGNKCYFVRECESSHFLLHPYSYSSAPAFIVLRMLKGTSLFVLFTGSWRLKQHQTTTRHQCHWELVTRTGRIWSGSPQESHHSSWAGNTAEYMSALSRQSPRNSTLPAACQSLGVRPLKCIWFTSVGWGVKAQWIDHPGLVTSPKQGALGKTENQTFRLKQQKVAKATGWNMVPA